MIRDMHCNRSACDFSTEGKFCETLDNAGVPRDSRWRTLILYMRGLQDYSYLTDHQKKAVQQLLVDVLTQKDFSERRYNEILRKDKEILVGPYEEKLVAALQETVELADAFKRMVRERKGDVQQLEQQSVEAVASGKAPDEIVALLKDTFQDVLTIMEKDAESIDRLSRTDALTRVNNRRGFDGHLQSVISSWKNGDTPLALAMFDIDFFKKFNDEYGHRIGDQALIAVAKMLHQVAKEFEVFRGEICVARYGGEEFAAILSGSMVEKANSFALQFRERMEKYSFVIRNSNGAAIRSDVSITVSGGVAEAEAQWGDAVVANLIDAADKALYYAKREGRNRIARSETGTGELSVLE